MEAPSLSLSLSSALGTRPGAPYCDACPLPPTLRKLSNWPADAWKVSTPAVPAPVDTPRWIVPFCRTWASSAQARSSASQPRSARVTFGADYCRHERVDRLGTVTDRVGHNTGGLGALLAAADNKAERVVVAHRCNPANHHCRRIDRHRIAPQCCGIARQCRAARSQRDGAIGKRIACCPQSNGIARVDEWKYVGVVFGRHRRAGRERRLHRTGNRTRRRISDSRSLRTKTLAIDQAVRRRRTTRLRHCGECDGTARQHYADGSEQAAAHSQTAPRRHVRDNRIMHRLTGGRPPSAFSILFIEHLLFSISGRVITDHRTPDLHVSRRGFIERSSSPSPRFTSKNKRHRVRGRRTAYTKYVTPDGFIEHPNN